MILLIKLRAATMKSIALTILLAASLQALTQENSKRIDSLSAVLASITTDTERVKLMADIAYAYRNVDPRKGMGYAEQADSLSEYMNWKEGKALAKERLGLLYISLSDHPNALDNFSQSLKLYNELATDKKTKFLKPFKDGVARNYGNIGMVYLRSTNYEQALANFSKSLNLYKEINDSAGIARVSGNIGILYFSKKDAPQALRWDSLALKIYKSMGDKAGIARNIENIGLIFTVQHNYDAAFECDFKALQLHRELNSKSDIAINLGNIGGVYLEIAKDSIYFLNKPAITREAALKNAIDYLQQGINIETEVGELNALQNFYKDLSEAQTLSGAYTDALESYKQHIKFKDSVFSLQNAEKIANLEARHELEKQKELNKLSLVKKRNENIFLAAGIILLLFATIFIAVERKKSDALLLNVLPSPIVQRLKQREHPIADYFSGVSILFIDIADFTNFSKTRNPKTIVNMLNDIFTRFDACAEKYGLEKIKTIGDSYMAVCGLPEPRQDHAIAAAQMAIELKKSMAGYTAEDGTYINFRYGLDCGPVVAGVIGKKKFIYDLWGDAVNTASRMEATGVANEIHCTDNFKNQLEGKYTFISRGLMEVKGKGAMQTWLLDA